MDGCSRRVRTKIGRTPAEIRASAGVHFVKNAFLSCLYYTTMAKEGKEKMRPACRAEMGDGMGDGR